MSARQEREGEMAELRSLAERLLKRIEKMQAELTADTVPANDAEVKPTLEDHAELRAWRRKRGHRG